MSVRGFTFVCDSAEETVRAAVSRVERNVCSLPDSARRAGVSAATLARWCRLSGVPVSLSRSMQRHYARTIGLTDSERDRIAQLYTNADGSNVNGALTIRQIQLVTGWGYSTIRRALHRRGVKVRSKGKESYHAGEPTTQKGRRMKNRVVRICGTFHAARARLETKSAAGHTAEAFGIDRSAVYRALQSVHNPYPRLRAGVA